MSIKYTDVVPWGRNFDEYCRMFALDEEDLTSRILGCGDGPASFNCECRRRGVAVVSVDHPWASKNYVTAKDFKDENLLVYSLPVENTSLYRNLLSPAGVTPLGTSIPRIVTELEKNHE